MSTNINNPENPPPLELPVHLEKALRCAPKTTLREVFKMPESLLVGQDGEPCKFGKIAETALKAYARWKASIPDILKSYFSDTETPKQDRKRLEALENVSNPPSDIREAASEFNLPFPSQHWTTIYDAFNHVLDKELSLLSFAAKYDNLEAIADLLEHNDFTQEELTAATMEAAKHNSTKAVDALLNYYRPTWTDRQHILSAATSSDASETLKLILERTIPNLEPLDLSSILVLAIKKNYPKALDVILKHKSFSNQALLPHLKEAALQGHLEIVKVLINAGADINHKDQNGTPTLFQFLDHDVAFNTLMKAGVKLNFTDREGNGVMHYAIRDYKYDRFMPLINQDASLTQKNHAGITPLHLAAQYDPAQALMAFMHMGINQLSSPLGSAIASNLDLNQADQYGNTILHMLANNNFDFGGTYGRLLNFKTLRSIRDFYNRPLNLNIQDQYGQTPLYIAAATGNTAFLKTLLIHDANPNISANDSYFPLHQAAAYGNDSMLKNLITFGASINATDARGATALHMAASNTFESTVELLLSAGASPLLRDHQGHLPIDYAAHPNTEFLISEALRSRRSRAGG